jgi:hypothetical protein
MASLVVGVNAETMSRTAFATLLATRRSETFEASRLTADGQSTTDDASTSASTTIDVIANDADAYGVYVSLMRSGLWCDATPMVDEKTGAVYFCCEPRETPTERRKDQPREARPRTIAVPFGVSRACVTPTLMDVITAMGGKATRESRVKSCRSARLGIRRTATDRLFRTRSMSTDGKPWPTSPPGPLVNDNVPRLVVMIDSDGTTTTARLSRGFVRPPDVPEKTGDDDDSDAEDADDRRDENAGTAGTANVGGITRAVYSDGESDEDLLEDETAPTLAERHARPESD